MSQQQLARGARVVEVLKQPQYRPVPVEREVVSIWTATGGYLDDILVEDAKRFVEDFLSYVDTRHPEVFAEIRDTGDLSDQGEDTLKEAVASFAQTFVPTGGEPGSAAAAGEGTPPDEVRPDVGWDRMSSADEDEEGAETTAASETTAGGETEAAPADQA